MSMRNPNLPDDPASIPAVAIRKLLYSDRAGVFLGFDADNKPLWSKSGKDKVTGAELAPTFLDQQELALYAEKNNLTLTGDAELREVHSTHQGHATADDAANSGVPRWGGR